MIRRVEGVYEGGVLRPTEVQNRALLGKRVKLKTANPFKIWCGEGDLNPHEIAPASTSS